MAQGNTVIDLTGGSAGANIIAVDLNVPKPHFMTFTHKDGSTTEIDLTHFAVDLNVDGIAWKTPGGAAAGIIELSVTDSSGATPVVRKVQIDLNAFTQPQFDAKVDKVTHTALPGAVNTSGELVLSQEDFTTALMTKLNNTPADMVTDVVFDAATEDITVSFGGSGAKPDYVISKFSEKVDKVPGWALSQNDLTDAIKAVYDQFDPDSIASLAFNPVNGEVTATKYDGSAPSVIFVVPVQVQADWAETNTSAKSFVKNKQIVQDQIDTNINGIAANKAANIVTNTAATALDVRVTQNAADILANKQATTLLDVKVTGYGTTITQLQADITGLGTENIAERARITTNESDIADLQNANATEDGRIVALETGLAANDAHDASQDTEIATNKGTLIAHQTDIATNTANIATHTSEIANMQAEVTINTSTNAAQQIEIDNTEVDVAKNTADILTLKGEIGMSDNQIRDAVQRATNSNVLDDADKLKLDNLSANQKAIDAAQDVAIALNVTNITQEVTDRNTAIAVETAARIAADTQEVTDRTTAIAAEAAARTAADTAAATKATADFVNVTGDTMTGALVLPKRTAANQAVSAESYATATLGGTLKAKMVGTILKLTNNGTNP